MRTSSFFETHGPGKPGALLPWGLALAVSFGISPLYSANQNTYFLAGLAKSGLGFLSRDWLLGFPDLAPGFSALVYAVAAWLHPALFYVLHLGIFLVLAWSLDKLARVCWAPAGKEPDPGQPGQRARVLYWLLCLVVFSGLLRMGYPKLLPGPDLGKLPVWGFGDSSVLATYLVARGLGVLYLAAVALFCLRREKAAWLLLAAPPYFHGHFLLDSLALGLAFAAHQMLRQKKPGPALLWGGLACLAVAPLAFYVWQHFQPGLAAGASQAKARMLKEVIYFHGDVRSFTGAVFWLQTALALAAARLAAGTRLGWIISWLLGLSLASVAAAWLSGSTALAFMQPWQVSAIAVLLASGVLLARAARALAGRGPALLWLAGCLAGMCLLAGAGWSVGKFRQMNAFRRSPVVTWAASHKQEGWVFLTPMEPPWDSFRLLTGAPQYLDGRSHPFGAAGLAHWLKRRDAVSRLLSRTPGPAPDLNGLAPGRVSHLVAPFGSAGLIAGRLAAHGPRVVARGGGFAVIELARKWP